MFTREQFAELPFEQKKEVLELRAKFHKKKAKATAEMKRIPKNGFNSQHNYYYARESDVKDMIREILNENNLSISTDLLKQTEGEPRPTKNGGMMTKTNVKMEFIITDAETGYFEAYIHDGSAMDTGDKGIYKAYSNTIKYFLMDQFLIPTGDDVEKESPEPTAPPQQQGRQQPPRRTGTANGSQGGQAGNKPTWRLIMDAEDELVRVAGTVKVEIRNQLKDRFGGPMEKYKEMEERKAEQVLKVLNEWIEKYSNPQG
jgi:hypothetical protein